LEAIPAATLTIHPENLDICYISNLLPSSAPSLSARYKFTKRIQTWDQVRITETGEIAGNV
jgi:hypothetical protein